MARKRDTIVGSKNFNKAIMVRFMKALSHPVYAEEKPTGDDNHDDNGGTTPTVNFEELIQKARKEEKDKQYATINRLKEQVNTLTTQHNNDLLKIGDLDKKLKEAEDKLTKAGEGDSETIKTLRAEIATLQSDKKKLEESVAEYEKNKPASREEIEKEIRADLEKEYEVKAHKAEVLAANKDKLLVPELVFGNTIEEIDSSLKSALERSAEIRKSLGIPETDEGSENDKGGKEKETTKKPPQKKTPRTPAPSDTGEKFGEYSLDYIASLDPSSDEYREFRKKMGLK